ncbi:MAG: inorganic phosphate transporter [Prochloraceae cyanobacterium]|nr:inorganic phosphate transporter [Prochloraceae cyanobacterium]
MATYIYSHLLLFPSPSLSLSSLLEIAFVALLAFYVAWNLGANDVANSMGTSVGSKALTLRQAIVIAGILEFTGAVIFSQGVSSTLGTGIANPSLFAQNPQLLLVGMVAVLISCGTWLQIATSQGLPVASSHAVVGAIAGFSWVAAGREAVEWVHIGNISVAWLITPLISGSIAALFYSLLKHWILDRPDAFVRLKEWIPWLSSILLGLFGVIVLPTLFNRSFFSFIPIPIQDLSLALGGIAAVSLTVDGWRQLERLQKKENDKSSQNLNSVGVEKLLARFQIVSACFVAFGHGSNDVGNAIAPLATIVYIFSTNLVPLNGLSIPLWILVLGGLGIVAGLTFQGKNVIDTVGEKIIPLQPSSGFSAEIATATTILLASRFGLPVSTSHALVGSVIGIGIVQNWQQVNFSTIKSVILAWVITLPITAILGAISFTILRLFI